MKKDQCHLYFGLTNAEDRTKIMKGDAIMKRKIMAVLLAAAMTGSLAGCGSTQNKNAADASEEKMKVAMVTDSGDITDQSFNQMTYEACKAWGKENDIEFNYYKPQSDSDEARTASVDQAVADGANVIVLALE